MHEQYQVEMLQTLIKRRDQAGVDALLAAGANIDCQDAVTLETAVHAAVNACVVHRDPAFLEQILARGATRVSDQNMNGCTPLHYSVNEYFPAVTHQLLERGAETGLLNKAGVSVFQYPVSLNHIDVVRDQLSHKGDPKLMNGRGQSLLHTALEADHQGIVALQQEREVSVDTTDCEGYSPLYWCVYHNRPQLVREIGGQCVGVADKRTLSGESLLHCAGRCGHDEVIAVQKEEFGCLGTAELNAHGESPLLLACRGNHMAAARLQLDETVLNQVSTVNQNGCLHEAVRHKNQDLVEWQQSSGCSGHLVNKEGLTPWLLACKQGSVDVLQVLQLHQLMEQDNPLSLRLAVESAQLHVVEFLLEKKTEKCSAAVSICVSSGDTEMLQLLLLHGYTPVYEDFVLAAREGDSDIIAQILQYKDVCLDALLHDLLVTEDAVADIAVFEQIQNAGVSLNHRNKDGDTVLHVAARAAPTNLFFLLYDAQPGLISEVNSTGLSVKEVLTEYSRAVIQEQLEEEQTENKQ